ncbi:MAG: ABC transporter permease [Actinobacteria bacterium]|nr:ABC transporter permease [Actinomycetota bacterium]
MSPDIALATASRVLRQLRRDPRTLVLIVEVPCLLLTLLQFLFDEQPATFQRVGVPLVGIFPFVSLFVVTSITMLRERTTGTLERLMSMPLAKLYLLAGYGMAFALVAAGQATIVSAVAFGALGLEVDGSLPLVIALAVGNAVLGMALGLFASAFATTEFQAVQFMPAFVVPQILLSGLFVPTDRMTPVLEGIAHALPLTYAFDALTRVARGVGGGRLALDVAVIVGAIVVALVLGAATLRRRTA